MKTLRQNIVEKMQNLSAPITISPEVFEELEDYLIDIAIDVCNEELSLSRPVERTYCKSVNTDKILYIKKIISHLEAIHNGIEDALPPSMERLYSKERKLKPQAQEQYDALSPLDIFKRQIKSNYFLDKY